MADRMSGQNKTTILPDTMKRIEFVETAPGRYALKCRKTGATVTAPLADEYSRDSVKACKKALRWTVDIDENERLECINLLLGTHGTEAVRGEWQNGPSTPVSFFRVEYTDTFGGEANYSWCRRATVALPGKSTEAQLKRKAKRVLKLTGCPGRWHGIGEFRPYGCCTVLFTMDA